MSVEKTPFAPATGSAREPSKSEVRPERSSASFRAQATLAILESALDRIWAECCKTEDDSVEESKFFTIINTLEGLIATERHEEALARNGKLMGYLRQRVRRAGRVRMSETVASTQEGSPMQRLDMAEREPREGTMLGGGSARASMVPGRLQDRLTHLDLFSGIGGFSLASNQAGFETVGFAEIDTYASKVLKKHWPNVPNFGDIRTADWSAIGDVTVLSGGFPCQPWSLAGKRGGKEDNRHLWPAMLDVIAAVRPAWVIGENTPDIANLVLADICSDLEGLGFQCQPFIVPACAVGAPHIRERVWIVAHARGRWNGVECARLVGEEKRTEAGNLHFWESEPMPRRVVDGIPNRVDRLRGIGNAIVPAVALPFFDAIAALEFQGAVAGVRGGSAWEHTGGPSEFSADPSHIAKLSDCGDSKPSVNEERRECRRGGEREE